MSNVNLLLELYANAIYDEIPWIEKPPFQKAKLKQNLCEFLIINFLNTRENLCLAKRELNLSIKFMTIHIKEKYCTM